jgi:Na+/H+-dicarboxylate symporter
MSEARAITNTIGNGVGALVVGRWVGAVDRARMQRVLDGEHLDHEIDTDASVEGVREDVAVQLMKPRNASA